MITVLCCATALGSAVQTRPTDASAITTIQGFYDQANAFKLKKDSVGLEKFFREHYSSYYLFYGRSGKSNLDQAIQGMKSFMQHISSASKATTKLEKLTRTSEGAVTNVHTVFVFLTKPMDDGHAHVLSEQIEGQDRWIWHGGKWSLLMSRTTSEKFLRDGRPIR